MDKFRDRKFCLLLYPEDASHVAALDKLKCGYEYIGILHDKDTYTADDTDDAALLGTLKKPHYHVIIKFPQARWNTAVAVELGLAPNYIQKCANSKGAVLYLIHSGLPNKFQYSVDDVFGTLTKDLSKFLRSDDECSRVRQICDFIDNSEYLELSDVIRWALDNDLYGDLRRMGNFAMTLIMRHNQRYDSSFCSDADLDRARFAGFAEGHSAGLEDRLKY